MPILNRGLPVPEAGKAFNRPVAPVPSGMNSADGVLRRVLFTPNKAAFRTGRAGRAAGRGLWADRAIAARWFLALAWLCAWTHAARAQQDVVVPPPPVSATPPAVQEYQNSNPMQVFPPSANASALPVPQLFQRGPLTLRPHALYRFLYGNGIESSPGQRQDTIVQTVSPGMLLDLGTHWSLDYTPSLTFYSSSRLRNTLDHDVRLNWGGVYNAWVFGGSQSCVLSAQPTVETGAQTEEDTYATALNASCLLNRKLSLDAGLNQALRYVGNGGNSSNFVQHLADSKTWSTLDWLNYLYEPGLNGGLGIGLGYNNLEVGSDSMYEQYQGRINWRATQKISFQVSGGVHDQQYLSGGASDLLTPIFGGIIQYQPFEQTQLTLTGGRTVSTSYFENQTTEDTSVTGDLNQRLLGTLYLDLSGAYTMTKYVSSATLSNQIGYGTGRSDDYYSFKVRLTCPFLKRGTFSVFYQYSDNSSTQTGFLQYNQQQLSSRSAYAYTSSQVGVEIAYRY